MSPPDNNWPTGSNGSDETELRRLEAELEALNQDLEQRYRLNPLRLIRHPRDGLIPLRPFKRQREFIDNYRRCVKIAPWVGPNRPGKSIAAAMIVEEMITGWPIESWPSMPWEVSTVALGPPRRVGCVTISKEKSRDGQQKVLGELTPRRVLACPEWNARTGFGGANPKLVLTNGSVCDFLSDLQREQTFEQFAWDLCWIDEAVAEWVKDRVVARLVDTGGKIIITSVGELAWLNKLARGHLLSSTARDPAPPGFIVSLLGSTMRDNELLSEADIAATVTLYGGADSRQARMRVEGEDILGEGLILDRFDELRNIDRQPGRRAPEGWTRYEYADPGYRNPFGWGFVAIGPGNKKVVDAEIYEKGLLPHQIAELVKAKRKELGYVEPYLPAVIDPASEHKNSWGRPKVSDREELWLAGIKTVLGEAGPGSVEPGNNRINGDLDRGDLAFKPHCVHHVYECQNYRIAPPDKRTNEYHGDREKPIDAYNHLIAGLRYLYSRRPVYVPLPAGPPPAGSLAADLMEMDRRAARKRRSPYRR